MLNLADLCLLMTIVAGGLGGLAGASSAHGKWWVLGVLTLVGLVAGFLFGAGFWKFGHYLQSRSDVRRLGGKVLFALALMIHGISPFAVGPLLGWGSEWLVLRFSA